MEQTEIEALKRYGWSDDEIAAPPQNGFPQLIWPYYPDAPDLKVRCFSVSQTESISQPRSRRPPPHGKDPESYFHPMSVFQVFSSPCTALL
jgi:hypothetical protein